MKIIDFAVACNLTRLWIKLIYSHSSLNVRTVIINVHKVQTFYSRKHSTSSLCFSLSELWKSIIRMCMHYLQNIVIWFASMSMGYSNNGLEQHKIWYYKWHLMCMINDCFMAKCSAHNKLFRLFTNRNEWWKITFHLLCAPSVHAMHSMSIGNWLYFGRTTFSSQSKPLMMLRFSVTPFLEFTSTLSSIYLLLNRPRRASKTWLCMYLSKIVTFRIFIFLIKRRYLSLWIWPFTNRYFSVDFNSFFNSNLSKKM